MRLRHIALFFLCALFFPFRGSARRAPASVRSVLIVPAGKLGDVVCTTPVFSAVRKHFPDARIYCEDVRGINHELLKDSGLVDAYVSLKHLRSGLRELRAAHIDAAVLTGPSFFMLALCYLANIPLISVPRVEGGICPQETKTYKLLSRLAATSVYRVGVYAPRERLRMLEPLGIVASDTTKHLGYSEKAAAKAAEIIREHNLGEKFVCMSPGAGNKIKQWPPERFAQVAEYIAAQRGLPVAVIGTSYDRHEVDEVMKNLKQTSSVVNLSEHLSIDELKAFISKASLFVSVDTGPLYIAEAFNVPTLDITGPIDEREQPPIGPRNVVVVPHNRTKPELFVLNARMYDEKEALRQVESITIEEVIVALDSLILSLS